MSELDIHLPGILLAYTALIVGICSPGPAVLAIIGTSMSRGRRPGVALALGVVCGSAFWGVMSAAGMSAILTTYAQLLFFIKIAGGLYLLWLAWKSFKAATGSPQDAAFASLSGSPSKMWLTGLLIHLTNPKAIGAWVATIALGVTATSPLWVSFAIVLGGVLISLIGNLAYAFLFSTDRMSRWYAKARKPIQYVFAAVFGAAGLRLLTSR